MDVEVESLIEYVKKLSTQANDNRYELKKEYEEEMVPQLKESVLHRSIYCGGERDAYNVVIILLEILKEMNEKQTNS